LSLGGCLRLAGGGSSGADQANGATDRADTAGTETADSDDDGVIDTRDEYPNDPSRSEQLLSASITTDIQPDERVEYSLSFSEPGVIEYDFIVRDGPRIDAILLNESEYRALENGERWRYYTGLSVLDAASGRIQRPVNPRRYHLVFDNTSAGEASPPVDGGADVATVELSIETSQ
jgi:cobalamin biosynthesis protein CobT